MNVTGFSGFLHEMFPVFKWSVFRSPLYQTIGRLVLKCSRLSGCEDHLNTEQNCLQFRYHSKTESFDQQLLPNWLPVFSIQTTWNPNFSFGTQIAAYLKFGISLVLSSYFSRLLPSHRREHRQGLVPLPLRLDDHGQPRGQVWAWRIWREKWKIWFASLWCRGHRFRWWASVWPRMVA